MHPSPKAVRLRKLSHLRCALMKRSVFFWQGWIKKNQISVISYFVCVAHSFHFTSDSFPAVFPLPLSQRLAWRNTLKPSSKPISLVTLCLSCLADWWQIQSILCSQRAAGFGESVSVCSIIFWASVNGQLLNNITDHIKKTNSVFLLPQLGLNFRCRCICRV